MFATLAQGTQRWWQTAQVKILNRGGSSIGSTSNSNSSILIRGGGVIALLVGVVVLVMVHSSGTVTTDSRRRHLHSEGDQTNSEKERERRQTASRITEHMEDAMQICERLLGDIDKSISSKQRRRGSGDQRHHSHEAQLQQQQQPPQDSSHNDGLEEHQRSQQKPNLANRVVSSPSLLSQSGAPLPARLQGAPSTFLMSVNPRSVMNDLLSGHVSCQIILWKQGNCRIEEEEETMIDCIRRVGASNMAKVTPERCRESSLFQELIREEQLQQQQQQQQQGRGVATTMMSLPSSSYDWRTLKRTPQYYQQVIPSQYVRPYVPPHQRPPHSYTTGPRVCKKKDSPVYGCVMHPIGFHIPEDQIVSSVARRKLFDFLPFIPRWFPISDDSPAYTLGVNDEYMSNILHEHSYFAFTHRRGGWDCLRHLEIMASGCVAYFPDMIACGKFCMPHMPKQLLEEVTRLPGLGHIGVLPSMDTQIYETEFVVLSESSEKISAVQPKKQMNIKTQGTIDWSVFDESKYFSIADALLNYTKTYLNTQSLATYILDVIDYPEPQRVLFLTGPIYRYLIQSVVHGFYDLGIHYTVYPMDQATQQLQEERDPLSNATMPFSEAELESNRYEFRTWQGLLFGYGMRVTVSELPGTEEALRRRIESGYYDLVIYPWTVHRSGSEEPVFTHQKPFWASVSKTLPPERIVFIDTTDDVFADPDEVLLDMCGKGVIFKRSLHDHEC